MSILDAGATRQDWPPFALADWEIALDLASPETTPARRAALLAQQGSRRWERAAALEHARQVRAQVEQRVAALLGAGVPS